MFPICVFSEVHTAPVQHPRAYRTEIGCLQVLSRLPHNTFGMCSTLRQLLGRSDRGMQLGGILAKVPQKRTWPEA
jgi:hypothetical protein